MTRRWKEDVVHSQNHGIHKTDNLRQFPDNSLTKTFLRDLRAHHRTPSFLPTLHGCYKTQQQAIFKS